MERTIREIGKEIQVEWRPPNYAAVPYIDAMLEIERIDDAYYAETARDVVARFLGNARSWRGEVARRVKRELNGLLKGGG